VLLIGGLIRFDRELYTKKHDSFQTLREGQLRLESELFHYGVIIVILGILRDSSPTLGRRPGAGHPLLAKAAGVLQVRRYHRFDRSAAPPARRPISV
jgi:hypothetical protein